MTLSLGRLSGLADHSTFSLDGDRLTASGWIFGSTLAEASALRDAVASMQLISGTEPIVSTTDGWVTGYYQDLRVSVDAQPGVFDQRFGFRYNLAAKRAPNYQSPTIGSHIDGANRTGIPGPVTAAFWHAVPSTVKWYDCAGTTAWVARTGPGGTVRFYQFSGFTSQVSTYQLDPADFYTAAPRLLVDSAQVVSPMVPSIGNASDWQIDNGLVKVTGSSSSSYTIRVYFPDASTSSSWGATPYDIQLGVSLSGTFKVVTISHIQLIELTAECVHLRCTGGVSTSGTNDNYKVDLDLRLRRGSFILEVFSATTTNVVHGIKDNAAVGYTAMANNEGAYRTSNDANGTAGAGNRLCMMSGKGLTLTSLASGYITATASTTWVDWGIGCEYLGGSSASPNRDTDIRDQYFANHAATVEL